MPCLNLCERGIGGEGLSQVKWQSPVLLTHETEVQTVYIWIQDYPVNRGTAVKYEF